MADSPPTPPANEAPPVSASMTPPGKDHTKLIFGIGLGLIVVALIGLGIWLLPRLLNRASAQASITAAAIPNEAVLFMSFNPHFSQLSNGDVVAKAWSDPQVTKSIEDSIRSGLSTSQLDWDQDIAPWLGDEIGVAMWNLPVTTTTTSSINPATPSFVFVLATRDATKSDALITKLRSQNEAKGIKYNDEPYRGIPATVQLASNTTPSTAYATINNVVVFASSLNDLHSAIDAALDKQGLDQSKNYQDTLAKLRGDRALTLYFNIAPFMPLAIQQNPMLQDLTADQKSALDAFQGLGLGLSFEPNGLRLEFAGVLNLDQLPVSQLGTLNVQSNPNKLLKTVPDSTFLYIGAQNLSALFEGMLIGMESADPSIKADLQNFEKQLGVSLTDDLFNQFSGEFAIVGLPGALGASGASQIPFGFALIAEAKDSKQIDANTHKFFQAIAQNSGMTISDVSINGSTLHVMKDSSGTTNLVYGLLSDRFVLATSVDAVSKIDKASSGTSLADDAQFKTATVPLPNSNGGYFYLKPQTIISLASLGLTMSGQSCPVCDALTPIKAIVSAVEQPPAEANVSRSILFMLLDVGK